MTHDHALEQPPPEPGPPEPGPPEPGPVISGLAAPPGAGYPVSNHSVKNRLSSARHAWLWSGNPLANAASSRGSVMDPPP
ncbi:MAG: hypothetical protein JO345_05735 [Streptosporangiaceae bacterium]|nr:hypothetical protein [Streptosporangiaceae bacterium]